MDRFYTLASFSTKLFFTVKSFFRFFLFFCKYVLILLCHTMYKRIFTYLHYIYYIYLVKYMHTTHIYSLTLFLYYKNLFILLLILNDSIPMVGNILFIISFSFLEFFLLVERTSKNEYHETT